jgi:hypothetical protein
MRHPATSASPRREQLVTVIIMQPAAADQGAGDMRIGVFGTGVVGHTSGVVKAA